MRELRTGAGATSTSAVFPLLPAAPLRGVRPFVLLAAYRRDPGARVAYKALRHSRVLAPGLCVPQSPNNHSLSKSSVESVEHKGGHAGAGTGICGVKYKSLQA